MKRMVICGSMSASREMAEWDRILSLAGWETVVPREDRWDDIAPEEAAAYKRTVSLAYFQEIADPRTDGVLIVNPGKHGVADYIGPNAFAEIAVAVFSKKPVYLSGGVYPPYRDELTAWGAVPLFGDPGPLTSSPEA